MTEAWAAERGSGAIPVSRSAAWPAMEAALIALMPVAAMIGLGMTLLDQFGYVDPEFYTGYGQSFDRMWHAFGLTYYAARFPVMALNEASQALFPGLPGYAIVRALVFVISAVPVYLLARRLYGPAVALAAYAFLVLNPLLARILLWDLTTFVSIPAALGGIALWYLSSNAWSALVLLAGFLFGVSINSHIFTGTAIGVFLVIEAAFAMRRPGGLRWMACRIATAGTGAVVCQGLGLLYYWTRVGYVAPQQLWTVTLGAVRAGQQYVSLTFTPFSSYFDINYEIYVPVFTTLLLVVLNARRLLRDSLEARITWFSVAYLLAYLVAVFGLRMNIVQYFWYFGHLTIVVYLAVPVILGQLVERSGARTAITVVFAAGLLSVAAAVALKFSAALRLSTAASGSPATVVVVCAAMLVCAGLIVPRRRAPLVAGAGAIAVVLQVPFLSASHLGLYDHISNRNEAPLFDAIRGFQSLLNRYEKPGERVMLWYPTGSLGLISIASSDLLFTLQDPWKPGPFPSLGATERQKLAAASVRFLLMMGEDQTVLTAATRALEEAHVKYSILSEETWGYAPVVIYARLVRLIPTTTQ